MICYLSKIKQVRGAKGREVLGACIFPAPGLWLRDGAVGDRGVGTDPQTLRQKKPEQSLRGADYGNVAPLGHFPQRRNLGKKCKLRPTSSQFYSRAETFIQ